MVSTLPGICEFHETSSDILTFFSDLVNLLPHLHDLGSWADGTDGAHVVGLDMFQVNIQAAQCTIRACKP